MLCLGFLLGALSGIAFMAVLGWSQPGVRKVVIESYEGNGYRREGSHVIVGTARPLSPDFEVVSLPRAVARKPGA